nr:MAG TPA: hypothetical protein [Caudoviricetes sp.]
MLFCFKTNTVHHLSYHFKYNLYALHIYNTMKNGICQVFSHKKFIVL